MPLVLVGTKMDLRDNKDYLRNEGIEPIGYSEGDNWACENGFVTYKECSVFNEKKRANELKSIFDIAIRAVLNMPTDKRKKKSKCVML